VAAGSAQNLRTSTAALAVALAIHGTAAVGILRVERPWRSAVEAPVEIEVREPPPPPPPEAREAPVEPPPEAPRPRPEIRRGVARDSHPAPPTNTPPPPNQRPTADTPKDAPPVFGVTMSSVVSGESAMAVPVGNTTMTKDRGPAPAPAKPYAGAATKPFTPVPDIYIATRPHKLYEINSADIYPADARALGIEGTVKLSVGLDEKGNVVEVRLIGRAGHEFDEAAMRAMRKFRFSPALTSDGRAVPYRFTYDFKFFIGD
jgi:periplasmic protein TonB